jgi:adenosylcobyric acid synthase
VAKALMIQGTGSGVGKSLISAAFCRIFSDHGLKVAPFKAQNMALNSCITIEGGEIGRAQVLQAEAARVPPVNDMNPVLLKASGDMGSQVIIHGKAYRHMSAREYSGFRSVAWQAVEESYKRLSDSYDVIIMEGAGSPAEINLLDVDIVNMAAAKLAKAAVLLVGDIDKGGVFASLYGTVKLLGRDSRLIKGFIINKFRGDQEILIPGFDKIREITGKPVIGILPYMHDLGLPEEDGLALINGTSTHGDGSVRIVVVRLRYISNFTDFDPFFCEGDVHLHYSSNPSDIENADIVIVPGSKNTVKDLLFLRENQLDKNILNAYRKGKKIIGICGGFQMLGQKIHDPKNIESTYKEMDGLGLLDIETVFDETKITCLSKGNAKEKGLFAELATGAGLSGYEIHMGQSTGSINLFRIRRQGGTETSLSEQLAPEVLDGSHRDNCWGTYLHGIFDNDDFRRYVLNDIRIQKGLMPLKSTVSYLGMRNEAIDRLAAIVSENIDMAFVRRLLSL